MHTGRDPTSPSDAARVPVGDVVGAAVGSRVDERRLASVAQTGIGCLPISPSLVEDDVPLSGKEQTAPSALAA